MAILHSESSETAFKNTPTTTGFSQGFALRIRPPFGYTQLMETVAIVVLALLLVFAGGAAVFAYNRRMAMAVELERARTENDQLEHRNVELQSSMDAQRERLSGFRHALPS